MKMFASIAYNLLACATMNLPWPEFMLSPLSPYLKQHNQIEYDKQESAAHITTCLAPCFDLLKLAEPIGLSAVECPVESRP